MQSLFPPCRTGWCPITLPHSHEEVCRHLEVQLRDCNCNITEDEFIKRLHENHWVLRVNLRDHGPSLVAWGVLGRVQMVSGQN